MSQAIGYVPLDYNGSGSVVIPFTQFQQNNCPNPSNSYWIGAITPQNVLCSQCPVIGGSVGTPIPVTLSNGQKVMSCNYPLSQFQYAPITDIQTWTNVFANGSNGNAQDGNPDYLNTAILPQWCGEQATTCVNDPNTGQPMPECSKIFATPDIGGTICQDWVSLGMSNSSIQPYVDGTMKSYCLNNNTSPDCGCLSRTSNPIYNEIEPSQPFQDGCWWIPCKNPTNYLVTSDLLNPTCPTEICDTIIDNINSKGIVEKNIKQYVSCSKTNNPTTSSSLKYLIAVFIGLVVVILIVLIVKNKKPSK